MINIEEHFKLIKWYRTKCRYLLQCTLYSIYFLSFISATYKIWIHGRYKVFKTLTFSAVQNVYTGYSFSEALILASLNPKYDNRLCFELQGSVHIKLHLQYMLCTSNCFCFYIQNNRLCPVVIRQLRKNQNLTSVCQNFTGIFTYFQFFWP